MPGRVFIRLRNPRANAGEVATYRLNDVEQREVREQLMAKRADEARSLVLQQLDAVKALNQPEDPRRALLQGLLDEGDALKNSDKEDVRKLRRKRYADAYVMALSILEDSAQKDNDEDLFYQGPSPSLRLAATAHRLIASMLRSFKHLPDATWREVQRLIPSADKLWCLGLVLAGWFIATIVGGWIGLAINGILLALGLMDLWERIKKSWDSFSQWFWLSFQAKEDKDLDLASQQFADGLSVGGLAILEVVVLHYAFKTLESKVLARFPTPKWLKRDFDAAVKQERARRPAEKPREEPARAREAEKPSKDEGTAQKRSERSIGRAVKVIGAPRAAELVPTGLSLLGWLAVLGIGYTYLQSRQERSGSTP